jgi:multicomponent K+:H+ antiporter subunit D
LLGATGTLMLITLGMAVLAAPVKRYTDDAANQLADTSAYVRAVLGPDAAGRSTTQPYDGRRNPPTPAGIPEAPR